MRKSIMVLTAAAFLPLTLAACGSGGGTTTAAAPSPSSSTETPVAPAAAKKPVEAEKTCTIKADLNTQPDGGKALLALTNTGTGPCTLQGWPTVGFLAANDSAIKVPVKKVDQPGAGPKIVLEPGRSAFAGVKWTTCDKGEDTCFVATTVKVTAPGTTKPVVADFIGAEGGGQKVTQLPVSSVEVGTLQPSTQGVVAW
ncbi:Protein of unknown function [Amycolatopsis xylanica]|uniref:DUF4232 domain-containing protein n=1 Tax=Amycolatopsis xylanica TaxID=589385 RepID=A0A1H3P5Y6_9PSEU|nr:DUF4232 domain-containing protein [Amycolatopsis xylanica]SDY95789.1 Protein of unknown function [Amycolatopsis xylanica]